MPGFGGDTDHFPTPNRRTHIWFDLNTPFITEPAYSMGRNAQAMFLDEGAGHNDLIFVAGGWSIKPYGEQEDVMFERTEGTSSLIGVNVAPGFVSTNITRSPSSSEMPGATTGASASLSSQGLQVYRKAITAGDDWDANVLTADQSAYPFTGVDNPYSVDDTIKLDRVAVSTENDSEELALGIYLTVFNSSTHSRGYVARIYFTGPAGNDRNGTGKGQYALNLSSTGKATLFEKLTDNSWIKRYSFNTMHNLGGNCYFVLNIYKSKECKGPDDGTGGWIKFDFGATPLENEEKGYGPTFFNFASTVIANKGKKRHHYKVPGDGSTPTVSEKIRIDIRRDISGAFNLWRHKYPTAEVVAKDSIFSMPFYPSETNETHPLEFKWDCCTPTGTAVEAKLMRADTDTELTIITQTTRHKTYETVAGVIHFYVQIELTAASGRTPVFKEWQLTRRGKTTQPGEPSWEIGDASHPKSVIRKVSIRGAERDLSHESASVNLADPLNNLEELKLRSGMPVRIETEWDPADSSKRSILFRGLVDVAHATRRKPDPKGSGFPAVGWNLFDVKMNGIWQILQQNFIDTPILSLYDPSTGIPYKVTDFLKFVISNAGFDEATDFDFPDLETRLHASPNDYTQTIDMLDKVSDVVQSLARDYLAHHLIFDPNVGTNGKWRLIEPSTAPYTNVAEFTMVAPTSPPKLVHYLPSYSGTTPILYPIKGNTVRTYVRKPEANWAFVSTIGAWNTNSPQIYHQTVWNKYSFNYMGGETADPENPDYLGYRKPIYVIDPAIGSAKSEEEMKQAVNVLARRIAELTFHANKMMTFEAPLALIEHESDATKRRPLRYYDPVLVDGTQWLIRNVNPEYVKDGIQYATYELEAPRI